MNNRTECITDRKPIEQVKKVSDCNKISEIEKLNDTSVRLSFENGIDVVLEAIPQSETSKLHHRAWIKIHSENLTMLKVETDIENQNCFINYKNVVPKQITFEMVKNG